MILYIPRTDHCDYYIPQKDMMLTDVIKLAQNPTVKYTKKDDVPLWAFYKPIADPIIGYYGKPKFITENFEFCFALLIDFDDGVTFDTAVSMYKDFAFIAYTSFRHTPEHNKFRMVVPLAKGFDHRAFRYNSVKKYFADLFPACDPSASIKTLQKHKIPAHHPNDTGYRFHINEAPRLIIDSDYITKLICEEDQLMATMMHHEKPRKQSILTMTHNELDDASYVQNLTNKIQSDLEAMNWSRGNGNNVHGNLLRCAYALQKAGVDYIDAMIDHLPASIHKELYNMQIKY